MSPSLIHDAIMQTWICALGDMRVVYLSGPITTGPRFLAHILSGQSYTNKQVIAENCAELAATAASLRTQLSEVIVEPASLSVPGWSQDDYLNLWENFIARHARRVIFMPGWQFSAGCAAEFVRATECGIDTMTLDGQPLDDVMALTLLEEASRAAFACRGVSTIDRLRAAIESAIIRIRSAGKYEAR